MSIAATDRFIDADPVEPLCIPLPAGRRQYRLVVDGRWIIDPHNPETEPNPYHETNSLVVVPQA